MKKRGITLLVLVITIIVLIILTSAIVLSIINGDVIDKSKKARFMSDFRTVQESVNLYSISKYNTETGKYELPLKGYLTNDDKTYIKENVPTLNTKIEELSGPIDTTNLGWINTEDINVTLSAEKESKGYIIDVATGQIYDYVGDVFESKRWHTLDGGVAIDGTNEGTTPVYAEEVWDGWIRLTLYYPAGATAKQWRLGTEGEIRADQMLMWQSYTGPITVPLDRVKDVWIKYKLNNTEVTIPPAGTLMVDIIPDKTGGINVAKISGDVETNALAASISQVNVTINFDETATVKEYRVGDSGWMTYTGPFTVTENCIVEARAKKVEYIYNTDGTLLSSRDIAGKDMVYIGNIGIEESELVAPTISRLAPQNGSEKARVQITYPANATKQIYKVNYGVEENYTNEISVTNYGTYIIAYYYDSTGKRSQATGIYINDTSTGTPAEPSSPHDPSPPYVPGKPVPVPAPTDNIIPAPTINVSPTTLVEEVQVSVSAPANADKVYIKLGRYADYQEYTGSITVRQNMEVYSYYTTLSGEKSNTASRAINNIKKNNRPYVYINANPYPWSGSYGATKVTVTIQYSDTNSIEYSEDGIIYKPYTAPFDVTQNKVIYARGINSYGVTETSLNITNIGQLSAPAVMQKLSVGINVNPEPTQSTNRVAKATVSIDYDSRATEKYYTIGKYGTLNTYTGEFDVTTNCTIYAYAKGPNSQGQTSKAIDNVSTGIAEPVIVPTPSDIKQASKVKVNITYDKYATIKRYSVNGGSLREYTGEFEITTNGSVIYAFSQNALGQKSEATYTIENIVPEPPVLLLDKGAYYLIKLNYPETSKGREYKWKANGEWKTYKDAGILLVKPQYKDQIIQNGVLVKIEDETGNLITFTGDYYLIDIPFNQISESIFMRWDREPLGAPQIIINPTEPAMSVNATIVYNSALIKKQYKIIKPGETTGIWQDYTGPILIDKNNTVIFANGMDDTEVWTADATAKVTNIDEVAPVIKLTADLIAAQQKVSVKVNVTDDVAVGKIKWAAGIQGESYFTSSGTEITNDTIVNITSNGYYTFYGEDKVGNKQVYTLNVTNVDLTPPAIDISISPETTVGLTSNVTINYGDATTKQYKVGTNNATWNNYTGTFSISSYTVLSNNWQNADGTVTVYAKGIDSSGNEITVQKKVLSLDLDKPESPVISSNSGYAVLSSYGVLFDSATTIVYDSRTDINNYYSIDNGTTWIPYTKSFNISSGTVLAKSVKKSTGLEVTASKTIVMPSDALTFQAYDSDDTTYTSMLGKYIKIDSSMYNQKVRIKLNAVLYARINIRFMNESRQIISSFDLVNGVYDLNYTVPEGTAWITAAFTDGTSNQGNLYEISPANEPTFSGVNGYMLLTADPNKAIRDPYQMVSISYFYTTVQRMYRIGTTGDWLTYNDQPIKVKQGETIYAKGIDQSGIETRVVASYSPNVADSLPVQVYDGNYTTSVSNLNNKYMQIDDSMQGKNIRVKFNGYTGSGAWNHAFIAFLDENKTLISQFGGVYSYDQVITIPTNAKWILYYADGYGYSTLYEIQAANEPVITPTSMYMLLTSDPTKAIKDPYQSIEINYFSTSVQKLYRIGTTGDWLTYPNTPIKLIPGQTIYAKGIDQYGSETRVISSYTYSMPDALTKEACDGNDSTYTSMLGKYIRVAPDMQGKNIRLRLNAVLYARISIRFMNESRQIISSFDIVNGMYDGNVNIPAGTVWITAAFTDGTSNQGNVYEIQPAP